MLVFSGVNGSLGPVGPKGDTGPPGPPGRGVVVGGGGGKFSLQTFVNLEIIGGMILGH